MRAGARTGGGQLGGGVVDLGEVGVRERLLDRDAPRRVELQHGLHQVNRLRACVREHRPEGAALHGAQGAAADSGF